MLALQYRPVRPALFVVGAGLLAYVGCSSGGSSTVSVTHPTMIEVSPETFLGEVPCSPNGPGLKRYVATLYDLDGADALVGGGAGGAPTDRDEELKDALQGGVPAERFQLPSSPPTPCGRSVGFGYVVPGRHYQVRIDGYDRDDLASRALGSREVTEQSTGKLIEARWRTSCARAIAVDSTLVTASLCGTFKAAQGVDMGSLRVPLAGVLGDLKCSQDGGQIDAFRVALENGDAQTVPCSSEAEAVFSGLSEGAARVRVSALGPDAELVLAAGECNANVVVDAQVDARCSRLTTLGTFQIDLQSLLSELGLSCNSASVRNISVAMAGAERGVDVSPPACQLPFQQGVPRSQEGASADVLIARAKGDALKVTCHAAQVSPAQIALAECDLPE